MYKKTLRETILYKQTVWPSLIGILGRSAVAISATAFMSLKMIIFRLPYIMYRAYPNFGYLTDNRNFGYDTSSRSCRKVGDIILSQIGSVFYSQLSVIPQNIDDVIERLCLMFSDTSSATIRTDALKFFSQLKSKGFVYLGEEVNIETIKSQYFSYDNTIPYELSVPDKKSNQETYKNTFGINSRLTRVHIDISSRCNEDCIHCYIPTHEKHGLMTEDMFNNVLKQCEDMNVLNLTISGGEPMLNPLLDKFLLKCRANNFSVNLLSNLTLLTDKLLGIIAEDPLISVQTSLYAMEENIHDTITRQHGSFQKTIKAIKKLHDRNVPLQINCPIMKQNLKYYKEVMSFANSLNIEADSDYSLYGCYDFSKSNLSCRLGVDEIENVVKEDYSEPVKLEEIKEKVLSKSVGADDPVCPVCKSSLCISNIGDVYPCEGWQSFKIGNVKEKSLKELWEKSSIVNRLRRLTYGDFPKCNACLDKKYCSACLVMNVNEDLHGNYMHINTFLCESARIKHSQMKRL